MHVIPSVRRAILWAMPKHGRSLRAQIGADAVGELARQGPPSQQRLGIDCKKMWCRIAGPCQ